MYPLTLLILFLLIFTAILIYLLLKRLISWSIKFKNWQKETKREASTNIGQLEERRMNNSELPDIEVTSLSKEKINIHKLIKNNTLLVFLDQTCAFCNANFESLFNLLEFSDHENLLILFKDNDANKAKEFSVLYNEKFKIVLVDESLFKDLQITFLPAYVRLDSSYKMKYSTPIPLQALNNI